MNDQDYYRKAIKLVGWTTTRLGNQRVVVFIPTPDDITHVLRIGYLDEQYVQDALAAELARQVDAIDDPHLFLIANKRETSVYRIDDDDWGACGIGQGRTMNTIKGIVDSGVLE